MWGFFAFLQILNCYGNIWISTFCSKTKHIQCSNIIQTFCMSWFNLKSLLKRFHCFTEISRHFKTSMHMHRSNIDKTVRVSIITLQIKQVQNIIRNDICWYTWIKLHLLLKSVRPHEIQLTSFHTIHPKARIDILDGSPGRLLEIFDSGFALFVNSNSV